MDASADLALHVPTGGHLATGPFRGDRLNNLLALAKERIPHYGFVNSGAIPFQRLAVPLAQAKVALVTTAGFHARDDKPFQVFDHVLGDPSYRWIPHDLRNEELDLAQPYVDAKFVGQDLECALPRAALDELAASSFVGAAASRHATFVGGVVWPYPDLTRTAGDLARELKADGVDCVVLTPTCSFCVQASAAIGRVLEEAAIPTVGITLLPELSEVVGAPRSLAPHFPFGAPCGDPGNASLQLAVLREALGLLTSLEVPGCVVPSAFAWKR